jgi:uncharacterized protein (TIGR00290 family)
MKSFISWSSGKDAAYTLHHLIKQGKKPDLLLTTVNQEYKRVSMHGLRIELLQKQAEALKVPLHQIPLSKDVDMKTYNRIMSQHLIELKNKGFDTAFFGDIFLEDLKRYRIEQMQKVDFITQFPIWGKNTKILSQKIIDSGIKAIVISVSASKLNKDFVGQIYNEDFLKELPNNVDPCGENGEFHTFVYDSPDFLHPIDFVIGKKTYKTYKPCSENDQNNFNNQRSQKNLDTSFWYIDLK